MSHWKGTITEFSGTRAKSGAARELTWNDMLTRLANRQTRVHKEGPAFVAGSIKPGTTRSTDNMDQLFLLVIDLDTVRNLEGLKKLWAGYTYALVSTHSHTVEHPRLRVIFPLLNPVPASQWKEIYTEASVRLSRGQADPACKDPSRLWYWPSCPPGREAAAIYESHFGDLLELHPPEPMHPGAAKQRGQAPKANDWARLLEPQGWTLVRNSGGVGYWARPGKDPSQGHSATTDYVPGRLHVFSAEALPFASGENYTYQEAETLLSGGELPAASRSDSGQTWERMLFEIADSAQCDWVQGSDGECYVRGTANGKKFAWGLRSKQFSNYIRLEYHRRSGRLLIGDNLNRFLDHCSAKASAGPKEQVGKRILDLGDSIWLDLARADGKVVRMTADGWEVVEGGDVLFRMCELDRSLPIPVAGGSLQDLRPLVNVRSDQEFALLACWLVGSFFPGSALPLLSIRGEQGSAKSSLARLLKQILDPSEIRIGPLPTDVRDLRAQIVNSYILGADNLSSINKVQSDWLCQLSTEGSFFARELYSDVGASVVTGRRPVILTSIEDVVNRADLKSRSVVLNLLPITSGYLTEAEIQREFEAIHAGLLGVLCTAVCAAISAKREPAVALQHRLADFVQVAQGAEAALGLEDGIFLRAFEANQVRNSEDLLESSEFGSGLMAAVIELGEGQHSFTASEWLEKIANALGERGAKKLPSANRFWNEVSRLLPVLRQQGVDVVRAPRQGSARLFQITYRVVTSVTSSPVNLLPDDDGCDDRSDDQPAALTGAFEFNSEASGDDDGHRPLRHWER